MSAELSDAATDRLLRALADGTRRGLLDCLRDKPGLTLSGLAAGFPQSRQALSKHLAALEAAELVVTLWRGREKLHYLNPLPLQALPARWVTTTAREAAAALTALERALAQAGGQASQPAAAAPAGAAGDPVALALAAAPGAGLEGERIATATALGAARHYLCGTADAVRLVLEAMPPDAGYHKPEGSGFSLVEHLWHLADIETLGWAVRFERLWAESRPRLPGVDGDRLAVQQRYQQRPWRGAARRFVAQRLRSLRALARFDEAALGRPCLFAGRRNTAGDVLAAMVAHDREHRVEMALRWTTMKGA